jgi:hypothetical protein
MLIKATKHITLNTNGEKKLQRKTHVKLLALTGQEIKNNLNSTRKIYFSQIPTN